MQFLNIGLYPFVFPFRILWRALEYFLARATNLLPTANKTNKKIKCIIIFQSNTTPLCTMVVTAAATPMDVSPLACDHISIINDTTVPPVDASRSIADPTILFGEDYSDCNGILSAMTPSLAAAPSSKTNKRKATSSRKKGVQSAPRRNVSPTMPSSSPRRVMYAAASLLSSFASSETVVIWSGEGHDNRQKQFHVHEPIRSNRVDASHPRLPRISTSLLK